EGGPGPGGPSGPPGGRRGGTGEPVTPERGYGRVFFNLTAGTGIGIIPAGNRFDVVYSYKPATQGMVGSFQPVTIATTGTALAPVHGELELGVNITRHVGLSLVGRME